MRTEGKRKAICITGMHRSGTSAFGGVLSALGVNMGRDLIGARAENPKGFYEVRRVVQLNDRVMDALDSWSGSILPLPGGRWESTTLKRLEAKAEDIIRSEFGEDGDFGMKAPRLCRLLPFWLRVFKGMGIEPYFIIVLRNPLEAAKSMRVRDGRSIESALMMWAAYMLEAELNSRGLPRVFATFDDLIENPGKVVAGISDTLGIDFPRSYEEASGDIKDFLEAGLKHHAPDDDALREYLNGTFSELFTLLSGFAYGKDASADDLRKIDDIRNDYNRLRGFFYYPGFEADAMFQKVFFGDGLEGLRCTGFLRLCVFIRRVRNRILPPHSKRREIANRVRYMLTHRPR